MYMMMFLLKLLCVVLFTSCLIKDSKAVTCDKDTDPMFKECPKKESVVKVGSSVTLRCSTHTKIQFCLWISPQGNTVSPVRNDPQYRRSSPDDEKTCHLTIMKAKEEDNGIWKCSPLTEGKTSSKFVPANVIVAVAFSSPTIIYDKKVEGKPPQKEVGPIVVSTLENEELVVNCKVPNARPAAEIKWYLQNQNNERIRELTREAEVLEPTVSERDNTLFDAYSTLKKTFRDSDNGKRIECVSKHIAAKPRTSSSVAKLDVKYPPKFSDRSDRVIHVQENKKTGTFAFKANPAPSPQTNVQVRVGDTGVALPGTPLGGFTVEFMRMPSPGHDKFEIKVTVDKMTPKIEKTKLVLFVENDVGSSKINLRFTSAAASSGSSLTTGVIIGIVVIILIIIAIIIVVFVVKRRRKEDPADEQAIEKEGDTESAADPKNKTISARINQIYSNIVKPKKGKEEDVEKGTKEETVPLEEKPLDKPEDPDKETEQEKLTKDEENTEKKEENEKPEKDKNVVYAELDLKEGGNPPKKASDETTEYAEIVGTVKAD